jgi:hypothetical protein
MGDVALAGGDTMEVGGPFPGAEDIAVGSVTVTPAEAEVALVVADVLSVAVDVASVAVGVASMVVDVASMVADVPSVAVHVASEAVDVRSVAADVASGVVADMPLVEADTATVEAEAVPMVVGAGRFRHNSKLSRPTAFAVGRFVEMKSSFLGLVRMDIYLAEAAAANLNDSCAGVEQPLLTFSVALFDDSVKVIDSNLPASWRRVSPTLRARFARRFITIADGFQPTICATLVTGTPTDSIGEAAERVGCCVARAGERSRSHSALPCAAGIPTVLP